MWTKIIIFMHLTRLQSGIFCGMGDFNCYERG
jgi:hypothetical protein